MDYAQWPATEESLFGGAWGGGSAAALSVSHLTTYLSSLIRGDEILQDVWVRGEASNLTRAASGHFYFSLKDDGACLSCVMWRTYARALSFRPEPGMQLVAHGRLTLYAPRGQYQLEVDDLQPDGVGALHLGLEQAKARLLAEGLLDAHRKRPLPAFPRSVAVVTSTTGAAVRDICVTLSRSLCPPRVVLVPVLVQGAGAEESLIRGLRLANERSGADLVIVGRGGGSTEDLWSFNSEALAREIAASALPVISAVGHESDFTLADMVADARAATPTAAAELVTERREEMVVRAQEAVSRARWLVESRLESARLRYRGVAARAVLARPAELVDRRRQRLDDLEARLQRARALTLWRVQQRLALAAGRLQGVSPLATLARGYAAVTRERDGAPLRSAGEVAVGERVRVRLADGSLGTRVEEISSGPEQDGRTADE
ncbi:MAG: exodeoxyribonuclease VII large subunit [Armatimonadota bacterium]